MERPQSNGLSPNYHAYAPSERPFPDVDAWCLPCNRGKWEAGVDICTNPGWHAPDERKHRIATNRRHDRMESWERTRNQGIL